MTHKTPRKARTARTPGRGVSIVLVVLGVLAVSAADVPQKSQTDYYFSVPYATNSLTRTNLVGKVVGRPPAYRALRREDIAWLREAASERAALAAGSWFGGAPGREERPVFGHFPLSTTNRFSRCTIAAEWRDGHLETNVVVGWNWVTNAFRNAPGKDLAKPGNSGIDVFEGLSFGAGEARYLASSNGLIQGSQFIKDASPPSHTNIVTTVVTNWGGFSFDDRGNLVWHSSNCVEVVTMAMTNGTTSVHTNEWRVSLPWETTRVATNVTGGSWLDLLFEGREAMWDDEPPPDAMEPFPAYSYVTNCYGFLARKKWLVDLANNTNEIERERYVYDVRGSSPRLVTNYLDRTTSIHLERTAMAAGGYPVLSKSAAGRLVFPTRFDWDVVHTGGVCRIKEATLYARADLWADWLAGSSYTNAFGYYMKKIGTAQKCGGPGGKVCYEATLDGVSIAIEGAAAIGAPERTTWAEWLDDRCTYLVQFYLVYELEPWASLPGW